MIFNMVGGGGGEEIELVSLTATANDTYIPLSGQAYNSVTVNVPAGYTINGTERQGVIMNTVSVGDMAWILYAVMDNEYRIYP